MFPELWNSLFGDSLLQSRMFGDSHGSFAASQLQGCFSRVFYGQALRNQFNNDLKWHATSSSWLQAYLLNLRTLFLPARAAEVHRPMLWVSHVRAPLWMQNINWSTSEVVVERVRFEREVPFLEQIAKVGTSSGLVSISGSSLAHQVFLPLDAKLLYVMLVEPIKSSDKKGDLCCHLKVAAQGESAGNVHMNTAMNLGTTSLLWRWCRPDYHNDTTASFSSKDAQEVMKLLISIHRLSKSQTVPEVHACVVHGNPMSDGWPRCDQHIVAPVRQPTDTSKSFPHIGLPFNGTQASGTNSLI